MLNKALADAVAENATTVKNALESYIASSNGAVAMDLTNEYGKAKVEGLDTGLWLVLETKTSESITSTTAPFFVSLPMTTVSGDENSTSPEGGHEWNYDVTVYPKNETGIPELTKEVREASKDTGKNNGSAVITDGFAHNATGSAGDVMEYQILSGLPTITSKATALTAYNFYDSICEGLSYNKELKDVKIEFFTDKNCTDNGKIVVIKQDVLRQEYRRSTNQIKLCTGGFGASPNSRGSACFCVASWQLAAAAVTGFIAKENVVGTLAVCFVGLENLIDTEELALMEGAGAEVAGIMAITKVAALAYLMFNLYTPPCFAALGAMNSEINDRKWFWGGVALQFATGYTIAFLVYQIGTLVTTGALGAGFLPGLIVVAAIVAVIVSLINKTNKSLAAEYALSGKK